MKRFYKMVTSARSARGYEIHLDGRPVKTPSGFNLYAPNEALAEAAVREWAAQEGKIAPDTMPLTQILTTACDRVAQERPTIEKAVLAYLDTDLLCYRATLPAATGEAQAKSWDPYIAWLEETFGASLQTTCDLTALRQAPETHESVTAFVRALDLWRFNILQIVTSLSGSLVLALAFVKGAATAKDVFKATHVEEIYKATIYEEEKHGYAPHVEKQREAAMRDLEAAERFLKLL